MRRNFQILALLSAVLAVSAQSGRRGPVYGGGIPVFIRARPDGVRAEDLSPPAEDPEAGLSPGVVLLGGGPGGGYRPVLTGAGGPAGHDGPQGVPLNLALLAALGGHVQAGGGYRGSGLADANIDDILSSIAQLGGARRPAPTDGPVRPGGKQPDAEDEDTADDAGPEDEEGSGAEDAADDADSTEPAVTRPTRGKTAAGEPGEQPPADDAETEDAEDAVTRPSRGKGPRTAARRGKQHGDEDEEDDQDDGEAPAAGPKPPRGRGGHPDYPPAGQDEGDAEGGEEESGGGRGVLHILLRPPGVYGGAAGLYPSYPGPGRGQGEGVFVVRPGLGSRPSGPGAMDEDAESGRGDADGVFVVRPGLGVVGRPPGAGGAGGARPEKDEGDGFFVVRPGLGLVGRPVSPGWGGARPEEDDDVLLVARPGAEAPGRAEGGGPGMRPGRRRPVGPGAGEDSDNGEGVLVVRPGPGGLGVGPSLGSMPGPGRGRGQRVLVVPVSALAAAAPPPHFGAYGGGVLGPMRPGPGGSSWDFLLGGPARAPADLPSSATPGVVMLGGWPFGVGGGPFAGRGPGESDGPEYKLSNRPNYPTVATKKKKPTKAKADKSPVPPVPSGPPTEGAGDAPSYPHDKDKPLDGKPQGGSDVELEAHDLPDDRDDAPEDTTAVTSDEMAEAEPTTPAGPTDVTDTATAVPEETTTLDMRT